MSHELPVKLKVLHIIDGFGTGGAETWLLQVARYAQAHPELGLSVDFLATGGEPAVFDEEVLKTGSKIFYLKYSLGKLFSFRKSFTEILKKEKYTAIHDHQDFVSGWHFLSAIGFLPAVRISHLHNPYNFIRNYVTTPSRWFSFRMGRLLMVLLCTGITGTSNAVMNEYGYHKWPYRKKRIDPVYCGFDVNLFKYNGDAKAGLCKELGWSEDTRVGVFIGRIDSENNDVSRNQKNPAFALDVAKEVVRQNKNWNFIFAGLKGVVGSQMEEEVEKTGLSGRIKFLGVRKDVPSLLSASDVLIFPSLWEGLGMIAVEAQATGLPVFASDALPREAIIIKELVNTESLSKSVTEWALELLNITQNAGNRPSANSFINDSPFSIQNSVARMISAYGKRYAGDIK
ncbi:glycosyltransferase [Longitalea arenae]|uniref:glycosyltransferase n=1 Tax=Longitalea arenae TaxID=2812558 RepID=UPI0019679E86|nr:glycosyltransferase [Longitalea arenae]